ncbi:MAG: AAA family ATPase, partial [Trebonia sp.]
MRYFNTTGPCDPARHYMLPAAARLPRARRLIADGRYFVVHAPRQTGKTTTMTALARELAAAGERAALLVSIESAGPLHEDIENVERAVLGSIRQAADHQLPPRLRPPRPWPDAATGNRISQGLMDWAAACPLPLALVIDEIDSLQGTALASVLRQIRAGFSYKPQAFPDSVVLCGMRDVQDYRIAAGSGPVPSSPWSPFNISEGSLRIGDFTRDQVAALYHQHAEETGQGFTPEAVERAYDYSQGQPWLVNALAYEITNRMMVVPPDPVTTEHVDAAREGLILAGDTHLGSLSARLH